MNNDHSAPDRAKIDERLTNEDKESPDAEYSNRDRQPVNERASETMQEIEDQNHPRGG